MKTTSHKNEDDLTQKMKTTSAKKWMQFYPKKENDLTQKLRRPHRKMKMTSHKNEDDLTSAKNLRDLPNKRRRPYPKNEGDLTQK